MGRYVDLPESLWTLTDHGDGWTVKFPPPDKVSRPIKDLRPSILQGLIVDMIRQYRSRTGRTPSDDIAVAPWIISTISTAPNGDIAAQPDTRIAPRPLRDMSQKALASLAETLAETLAEPVHALHDSPLPDQENPAMPDPALHDSPLPDQENPAMPDPDLNPSTEIRVDPDPTTATAIRVSSRVQLGTYYLQNPADPHGEPFEFHFGPYGWRSTSNDDGVLASLDEMDPDDCAAALATALTLVAGREAELRGENAS